MSSFPFTFQELALIHCPGIPDEIRFETIADALQRRADVHGVESVSALEDLLAFSRAKVLYREIRFGFRRGVIDPDGIVLDAIETLHRKAPLLANPIRDPRAWLRVTILTLIRRDTERLFPVLVADPEVSDSLELASSRSFDADLFDEEEEDADASGSTYRFKQPVIDALATLSPLLQLTARLYYYDNLSQGEIARELGIDEGTVRQRLYRIRTRVREALAHLFAAEIDVGPAEG